MTTKEFPSVSNRRGVIISGLRRADSAIRASSANRKHDFVAMASKNNLFLQMLDLRSNGDELITVSITGREGDSLHPFSTNLITGAIRVGVDDSPYTTRIPLDVLNEVYKGKGDIFSLIGQSDSWDIEDTNNRLKRLFREISLVSAALAKPWGSPNDRNRVRLDQLKAKLSVDVLTLWGKEKDQAEGMGLTVKWVDEGRKVDVRLGTTNKGGELESGFSLFPRMHFQHQPVLEQLLSAYK